MHSMIVSRTASNQTNMPGAIGPQLMEDFAARMYADSVVIQLVKWSHYGCLNTLTMHLVIRHCLSSINCLVAYLQSGASTAMICARGWWHLQLEMLCALVGWELQECMAATGCVALPIFWLLSPFWT